MTEAQNQPVTRRGRPPRELNTDDLEVGQRPKIILPESGLLSREPEEIVAVETAIDAEYERMLAFNEEPVEILIHPLQEKAAPKLLEFTVNGRTEWVPVNVPFIVARKYVEVIVRSKNETVNTEHEDANVEAPRNTIVRQTSLKTPFSVLRDDNPRGGQWLAQIMREG